MKVELIQQILTEGGNVRIKDSSGKEVGADRLDLLKFKREEVVEDLVEFFLEFSKLYYKKYHQHLYKNREELLQFLSGSARFLFSRKYSAEYLIQKKRYFNDIDVMLLDKHREHFTKFIEYMRGKKITDKITFVGYKDIRIQIDFELIAGKYNIPSEWEMFAHSHNEEDFNIGIKGVFHKLMIRALTRQFAEHGWEISSKALEVLKHYNYNFATFMEKKKNRKFTEDDVRIYAFSVDRGLRRRYDTIRRGTEILKYRGLPLYLKIPTNQSTYIKTVSKIAKFFFKGSVKDFGSFVGIVSLIKKEYTKEQAKKAFESFLEILWDDKRGIELYRTDKERDMTEKEIAVAYFMKELVYLVSYKPKIRMMKAKFYKGYGRRHRETEDRLEKDEIEDMKVETKE